MSLSRNIILVVLCLGAAPTLAHQEITFDCVAPVRPADDQNDALWQAFLTEIDAFQACVTAYADRQQAAADEHQRAAFAGVDAWNEFVRTSLNAPEDFPWPPEKGR